MYSGLYPPGEFKENCGFGLLAQKRGVASHALLQQGVAALACMTHRGGIAADGKTGDGCGILVQKPDAFLRELAQAAFAVTLAEHYGIGMVFLNTDESKAAWARETLNGELRDQGLNVVGWRMVPVDSSVLGPIALQALPKIEQIFIDGGKWSEAELSARMFIARRKANNQIYRQDSDFYICSLSTKTLCYKGLMMPQDLPAFYPDLSDSRFKTAICTFHQRFSTNTLPKWPLAQPFRLLAHNGEINTIEGNRNWSVARIPKFQTPVIPHLEEILPLVNRSGSDSSSLDNMLELLVLGGMDLYRALRLLMPPAWQNNESMDPDLRAFYEYNSMHMEAWDGPAGIVLTDGECAVCALDRNGLRPARWSETGNGIIVIASETGILDISPEKIVRKGRLGPGQLLSVDTMKGDVLYTSTIDERLKVGKPYKKWLKENTIRIQSTLTDHPLPVPLLNEQEQQVHLKMFNVSIMEREQILRPLVEKALEATGSMGDDTPMAVLSRKNRSIYDYFRQQFAQVTNPPIDPLREENVMSLETCLGAERNIFEETPEHAERVVLTSPVLSTQKFLRLQNFQHPRFQSVILDLNYDPREGLKAALMRIASEAVAAIRNGKTLIILSDRRLMQNKIPAPALLATGAVQHRLVDEGLRCDSNIIVETGGARDPHQIATLIAYGATAVYPYLSYSLIADMIKTGALKMTPIEARKNYRRGIKKGLLKILSKMGISTIASYRCAQLYEIIGFHEDVVSLCFRGTPSRIQGAHFEDLQASQIVLATNAWNVNKGVDAGGIHKYMHGGEYHAFNPDVVQALQQAVRSGRYEDFKCYADLVNKRPVATLRDLLVLKQNQQTIPLSEIEPVESILKRFDSAAMSLGALSPEAHEALAMAMNRLGGRSNSGEGGEDPLRFGTDKVSKIKQIASGRFGVTPHYLVNAEVLQIKIAQGAKPGEGGQLPGGKVNELIARLRYSVPGVTLISPPPHHDIYSIEDLAQLIYDLKQVNPAALVSVKLVSRPGVGTISTGIAKAYADLITISGYDGGTGASPLSSIHYAGSPWELGLAETHQALCDNGLRDRVRLQTDGGLKTGLDVVKAAILGAESFGFGTAPMVALGCKYLRICHLNNCATGVATQDQLLREKFFVGTVDMAINFFRFVAEEVRGWMAQLGVRKLEDLIGREDLLNVLPGETAQQQHLDLSVILQSVRTEPNKPRYCTRPRNDPPFTDALSERLYRDLMPHIENKESGEFYYTINNCNRAIGANLSGEIAKRYGNLGLEATPLALKFKGTAGQSFGVWNAGGLHLYLQGDANDYVGKGMAGGKIIIVPPENSHFESKDAVIIGNTCLYGATGGKLFASGCAGERFAVRNSGAIALVEGAGDHCCEYMTGGVVAVLGETGYNFGAGMTGGFAYVLDLNRSFIDKHNNDSVEIRRIRKEVMESHLTHLQEMVHEYAVETGSIWGKELDENFFDYISKFWLVKPKAASVDELLNFVKGSPQ